MLMKQSRLSHLQAQRGNTHKIKNGICTVGFGTCMVFVFKPTPQNYSYRFLFIYCGKVCAFCFNLLLFVGKNCTLKKESQNLSDRVVLETLNCQVESVKPRATKVHVLLPHELFHALACSSSPMVWDSIMLGGYTADQRRYFWQHVSSLEPWKNHPNLRAPYDKLIPLTLHGDGAIMKREDECFVFSTGSAFSASGSIKEILMLKWPICIIPERYMRSRKVTHQKDVFFLLLLYLHRFVF